MLLVNGTVAFSEWEEPSSAVMARFVLFSVANPRGILNGEEKPELIEMGPYAFRCKILLQFNIINMHFLKLLQRISAKGSPSLAHKQFHCDLQDKKKVVLSV